MMYEDSYSCYWIIQSFNKYRLFITWLNFRGLHVTVNIEFKDPKTSNMVLNTSLTSQTTNK